jgi:glutathione synthase/RimK-type ligase-like ATP-grasp enzyme
MKLEDSIGRFDNSDVLIFLESNPFGFYETANCNVINKSYFDRKLTDKYLQYLKIKETGLNYIPTFTCNEIQNMDINIFVSKPKKGSMGINVNLLCSKEGITDDYIFQPLIRNNGDWRVVVINNKAVSMIMRKGFGFLNNLAQGALGWSEWDNEAAYLAEEATKALDIEYAGVDIIKCLDTGKYYFLESNSTSTFDTSQVLTRIDIAEKLVEYIDKKYNK